MDPRYQVFVSSTYVDLLEERQAALKAILEIGQMPAGMELFPASDDSAWDLIKDVIDSSDYYVLIIGGRYGSLDEDGLGFTEKEYDYAVSVGKPVIALLHHNPDELERARTETDPMAWERLRAFRDKVEKKHTRVGWNSPDDLKSKVIVGLTSAMKRTPAVGWVRADQLPSEATVADVLRLRNRVTELESAIERERISPPEGADEFEHGDDPHEIRVSMKVHRDKYDYDGVDHSVIIRTTWNGIFGAIAPTLINEASDEDVRSSLRSFCFEQAIEMIKHIKYHELGTISISPRSEDTCIVQLRVLGLIKESARPRAIRDTATYWALSPYGDHLMTQLRAIRRSPRNADIPAGETGSDTIDPPTRSRAAKSAGSSKDAT